MWPWRWRVQHVSILRMGRAERPQAWDPQLPAACIWAWDAPVCPSVDWLLSLSLFRRRAWVPLGGLLGPPGPQGPAEGAGHTLSREAGQVEAGHPEAGRIVLGSSFEEELGVGAGEAGVGDPLIS